MRLTSRVIPAKLRGSECSVELDVAGWVFAGGKKRTTIPLSGKSTTQTIERDETLCCVAGFVRDDHNRPIDATVSIGDITTKSKNGRFSLRIPPDQQKTEQRLTVYKQGYRTWEKSVYPETKADVTILLTPER